MKKYSGFSMLELGLVMILLSLFVTVAATKFIQMHEATYDTAVSGTSDALQTAVALVHFKWQVVGKGGPVDNLDVYGTGEHTLDISAAGWPVQSWTPYDPNPTLDNSSECISLWEAILDDGAPSVTVDDSGDYQASYSGSVCTYTFVDEPGYHILYNSKNGKVVASL